MAMVPQEGNSNTRCFLIPPFQGEIKPPAMRVVVDLPLNKSGAATIEKSTDRSLQSSVFTVGYSFFFNSNQYRCRKR